eukprot:TRINITY_DN21463_c0_g1_i4.p1 TRINITY_DN21463_c0_g1~~TRINITY_DN21463_c0_g1_i4.p1  ORF type:complete len:153 (-),score=32.32 TRINITY_DN21463_c0_g1_i4:260-694(-)
MDLDGVITRLLDDFGVRLREAVSQEVAELRDELCSQLSGSTGASSSRKLDALRDADVGESDGDVGDEVVISGFAVGGDAGVPEGGAPDPADPMDKLSAILPPGEPSPSLSDEAEPCPKLRSSHTRAGHELGSGSFSSKSGRVSL